MTNPLLYHVCTSIGGSYSAGLERVARDIAAAHTDKDPVQLTALYVHKDTRLAEVVWTITPVVPQGDGPPRHQMSVWLAGRVIDQVELPLPA